MRTKKERLIIAIFCVSLLIVGFQNCAGNEPQTVAPTNPNSEQTEFLSKLRMDFNNQNTSNKCSYETKHCAENDLSCIEGNIKNYYNSLECLGYNVVQAENCILAASKLIASHDDLIDIDATCFYSEENTAKALHMDTCIGEPVSFSEDHPSTGTVISAWKEFGNKYPYSRVTKSLRYYKVSNPNEAIIQIAQVDQENSNRVQDACGKQRNVNWLNIGIHISFE